MCKKLIYSCFILVLVVMTVPALATDPILKVDLNGDNSGHDPARTQTGWTGWDFDRNLTKACFSNTISGCDVEICGIRHDGQNPGTRMRGDLCSWELGDMYQDLFFVGHSGDGSALGLDYIQVTVFGCLDADTQYSVGVWSFDSAFSPPDIDPCGTKFSSWGVVNPSDYLQANGYPGGYQTTDYDDPCTTENESGIYKNPVPTLDRIDMMKNMYGTPKGNVYHYSNFCVTTDEYGVLKFYGWYDGDTWTGSQHVPINGFVIIPEPATIALLGLGGLALLRRRRR